MRILVVGQIPPPLGGQAIMIQKMLDACWRDVELYHVRMNFSRDFSSRGRFSLYKVFHLLMVIWNILVVRFRHGIDVLYYPPSSVPEVAILRDVIILFIVRPFFRKTVFHFHAAGISEAYPSLNKMTRVGIRLAMLHPNLTITSSEYNPNDGEFLKGLQNVVIPLGIPDEYGDIVRKDFREPLTILFIGLLNGTKGELVLIDAAYQLILKGYKLRLLVAGRFESEQHGSAFEESVIQRKMQSYVEYLGVISGEEKRRAFTRAHLFCFPSYFASESFGVVLLEAMQASLPVIATRWRGIQSAVCDGETGYLVAPNDPRDLAEKIQIYLDHPEMLASMGSSGRKFYEMCFREEIYLSALQREFLNI